MYREGTETLIKLKIAPLFGAKQFTSSRSSNVACSTTMTIEKLGKTH